MAHDLIAVDQNGFGEFEGLENAAGDGLVFIKGDEDVWSIEIHAVLGFHFCDEVCDGVFIEIGGQGDQDDVFWGAFGGGEEHWEFFDARGAPGCPEIEDDFFAFEVGDVVGFAFYVCELKSAYQLVGIFEVFAGWNGFYGG